MNQFVCYRILRVALADLQNGMLKVAHVMDDNGTLEKNISQKECSGRVFHLQNASSLIDDVVLVGDVDGKASDDNS